jgi:hypothetical protein
VSQNACVKEYVKKGHRDSSRAFVLVGQVLVKSGSPKQTMKKTIGYLALAAVVGGILFNLKDIQRYIRISTM